MKCVLFLSICLILAIPCQAETIIVDANSSGDYLTIQAAINDASDDDIIEVQPGTYTGPGNRDIDFLGKAITVRSTNPNDPDIVAATIIDCNGTEAEPHRGFHFQNNEGPDSVLAGLTITNGYGPYDELIGHPLWSVGGAIKCISPTITKCVIAGNQAEWGGGIWYEGAGTISYCTITNNFADTIGAGILCLGDATISNCTISNNQVGGGICTWYGGSLTIANCIITGNNCEAVCFTAGDPESLMVTNCTISNNAGYGLYCSTTTAVRNSIIWGNADSIYGGIPSPSVTYSLIQGGWPGVGNIDVDPCFVTGPLGDYYLSQVAAGQPTDSPCVDAGSDTAVALGMHMYMTRTDEMVDTGIVDMGYHHPIGISADIDKNYHVDGFDYAILAGDWFKCSDPRDSNCIAGFLPGDITKNYYVNMNDLWILVNCWLDCHVMPASAPSPADTQGAIWVEPELAWSPGAGALYHDVYFGTDDNSVAGADTSSVEFMGTISEASFDPCTLEWRTWYYWRIDEVGPACAAEGDVWSFRTGVNEPNLVGWWECDEGSGTVAYDSAGNNDGTLIGDPNWVAGKIGSHAISFDGDGDYVNLDSHIPNIEGLNEGTIAGWFKSSENKPHFIFTITQGSSEGGVFQIILGPTTGAYDDEGFGFGLRRGGSYKLIMYVRNGEYAYTDGNWHHFAVCTGGGDNRIYIDGANQSVTFHVGSSSTNEFSNIDTPTSMKIGVRIRNGYEGYLDGILDDVRIYDRALLAEEILDICRNGFGGRAFNPNPANGAINVASNTHLTWSPGKGAISHDVYFSTDFNDVNDAHTSSDEYVGNQDINSYDPCGLALITTYYWRIDEINDSNTYKGDVWNFTTVDDPNLHLVGWWKFDEGDGNTAYDSAGNNDGTLNGDPNWVAGKIGSYALDFDGDGDYVNLDSHIPNIEGLNEGTIAGWFNSSEDRRHFLFTITKGGSSSDACQVILGPTTGSYDDEGFGFVLRRAGIPELIMYVRNGEYAYTDGNWHHFAVCTGGGDNRIYIDGVSQSITFDVGSSSTNEFFNINNPTSMKIGVRVRNNLYDSPLNGILDDVRIYDRALLAEEIQELYQDGLN